MTPPAASELDRVLDEIQQKNEPLGVIGWISGLGALLGLFVLGLLGYWLLPAHESLLLLQDDGPIRSLVPATSRLPEGSAEEQEAWLRAQRSVTAHYLRRRELLDPIAESPGGHGVRVSLKRLKAWAELRRVWAQALSGEGLTIARYRELANAAPRGEGPHYPVLQDLLSRKAR
ncbi:hypothetical protein ACFL59_11100 [Planctomycetota bacterium]